MNESIIKQIDEALAQNREAIICDLFRLVKIPSIEGVAEENAPFGKPCREALDCALSMFGEVCEETEACSGGVYGLATRKGDERAIGLFGHLDVVPVSDGWMYNPPFAPAVHDGYLVGRGISDNKAGVIMSLYALKLIRDLNLPLKSTVDVFLGCNEESGMLDIATYVQQQRLADVNIVPDGDYPMSLGEKGIFHLLAKAQKPFTQILSFEGGLAVNVILGDCTVTLKEETTLLAELSAYTDGKDAYTLSAKGGVITLKAKGVTAHGSKPQGSVNAGKLLLDALLACPSLNRKDKAILTPAHTWLSDDFGKPFGIDAEDPHFGAITATNGIMKTENGCLALSFDIRYGTASDGDVVCEKVKKCIENAGYFVAEEENSKGFSIDEDSAVAKAMIHTYKALTGQDEVHPIYMSGGTYARYLPCAFSIGTELDMGGPRLPMPMGHGECHQSDECISIDGFMASIKMLTCMILAIDKAIHKEA